MFFRLSVACKKGLTMKKKKINVFVVILSVLAVLMALNDLTIAVFPFAFMTLPLFELPLHFVAFPILVVLIAFFSSFCDDLSENRTWISGGLVLNVFLWVAGVLLLARCL